MKGPFDRAYAALEFLLEHALAPTPSHYEMAYTHLGGGNDALTAEVARLTEGGVRLTAEQASTLAAQFCGREDAAAHAQMLHHTERLETLTSQTQDLTGGFGRDLSGFPTQGTPLANLTTQMVSRLAKAERELADIAVDISALRERVAGRGDDEAHDRLTQAANRDDGDSFLVSLAEEPEGYTLALAKLDGLYRINEEFGLGVGDNVLRAMATTLRQACGEHELIRWAGDEFMTVFRGVPAARATAMIEEAREAMARRTLRLRDKGTPIGTVTFSAGIAAAAADGPAEAIRRAKTQVLAAIAQGGNRVVA